MPRLLLLAAALLAAPDLFAQQRPAMFHNPPVGVDSGEAIRVDGLLVHGKALGRVVLLYRQPGSEYAEVAMSLRYGDLYRGEIPAAAVGAPAIEYCIEGVPKAGGARVALFMSRASPVRVPVAGAAPRQPLVAKEPGPTAAERDAQAARADAERIEAARRESEQREAQAREAQRREQERRDAELAGQKAQERREAERAEREAAEQRARERRQAAEREAEEGAPVEETAAAAPGRDDRPARFDPDRDDLREREPPPPGAAPPAPRSELEEELAIYAAEDRSAAFARHRAEVREVPISSTTVSRDEMRAMGARTVADVLDVLPGLTVSRDVAGFYRTAVRGIRADPEVLFLLDGHPLNHFHDGRALWNLPIENLARIEVVRGPGPARNGPGAFLAVVKLVTDRSDGFRGTISGGGAGAVAAHVNGAQRLGEFRVHADADVLRHAAPAHEVPNDSLSAERIDQGFRRDASKPVGVTRDDGFLINAGAGFTFANPETGSLDGALRFVGEYRSALIGMYDTLGSDSSLGARSILGDLGWSRALTPSLTLRAHLGVQEENARREYQLSPATGPSWDASATIPGYCSINLTWPAPCDSGYLFARGIREHQAAGGYGADGRLEAEVAIGSTNQLTVGLDAGYRALYQREVLINYAPEDLRRLTTPTGADAFAPVESGLGDTEGAALSRLTAGFWAHDVWTLVEQVTLTAGFRVGLTQLPVHAAGQGFTGTAWVPNVDPRVGIAYTPSPGFLLTATYGRAFRAPVVDELVPSVANSPVNGGRFTGNPALAPSTVDSADLGADLVQNLGDARVRLRGNVFYEYLNNPITRADISGNIIPVDNRLAVRILGAEGEAHAEVSARARTWVNASWFRAMDVAARDPLQLLTDTPQWRVNVGLTMPVGSFLNLDVLLRTGAERRNLSRTPLENLRRWRIPSYNLLDVQLRTEPLFTSYEAALSVRNAFSQAHSDDAYRMDRTPGGVPREGLSAYLTLRGTF